MAAPPKICRPLAPEFIEVMETEKERKYLVDLENLTWLQKVLVNMNVAASSADTGFQFSREDINRQMDKMKEERDEPKMAAAVNAMS